MLGGTLLISKAQDCQRAGEPSSLELSWTLPSCHGHGHLCASQPAGLTPNASGRSLPAVAGDPPLEITSAWPLESSFWLLWPCDSIFPAQMTTSSPLVPLCFSQCSSLHLPQFSAHLSSTVPLTRSSMALMHPLCSFLIFPPTSPDTHSPSLHSLSQAQFFKSCLFNKAL